MEANKQDLQPTFMSENPVGIIYISNISEDVWPFISAISDDSAKQFEIEENTLISDRDLLAFAGKSHVRLILPQAVDSDFRSYFLNTYKNDDLDIWIPKDCSGEICTDIFNDKIILQNILQFSKLYKKLKIYSYTTSPQFLDLINHLRSLGLSIDTPETPSEADAWTVNFFGSKAGIRQLSSLSTYKEPFFKMSAGMIVSDCEDAAKIAAKIYLKKKGVVVKINKGHAGIGVYIWRKGDLPTDYIACKNTILSKLKEDKYWDEFSIVIEEYIDIDSSIGGGNPNAEFLVHKNGEVEFLFSGGMRVTDDGNYRGMEISDKALPKKVQNRMIRIGKFIGLQYAANGYCGYFDVDFVSSKEGEIFVAESNVRRTGGTHVYHAGKALLGDDFLYHTYALSTNFFSIEDKSIVSCALLLERLKAVLYDKKTKQGLVIVSVNLLIHNQFAYIIFAKNKKRALVIEAQMEELLRKSN